MKESNVLDKVGMVLVMNEPPGNRLRVALTGLTMPKNLGDEGRDILFFVDNTIGIRLRELKYPLYWVECLQPLVSANTSERW